MRSAKLKYYFVVINHDVWNVNQEAVIVTTLIAKETLKMQAYSFHGY